MYSVGSPDSAATHVSGLVKVDLGPPPAAEPADFGPPSAAPPEPAAARCVSWYRTAHYPSEPVFVPRPGATAEDDGVVLSVMLDGEARASYLLVLNATTMRTMATAYSPVVMPADFHGEWFSEDI